MQIDQYEIKDTIGEGGMSLVYRAQSADGKIVAIKVLHPSLAINQEFCARFKKEISIAQQLKHPNIVRVLDSGIADGKLFLAMQLMNGGDLNQKIKEKITPHVSLSVTSDIAEALYYAHQKDLIHRDIKPGNVLFDQRGIAYLADFGIAKVVSKNTQLTRTGMYMGTPFYMSPEQARGKKVDARADIYSLGVLLYEMLTGQKPYQAEDHFAVALMHINDAVPQLPRHLAGIQDFLDKCLAKDPEDRFANAKEAADAARQLSLSIPVTRIQQPLESTYPRPIITDADIKRSKKNFVLRATAGAAAMLAIATSAYYYRSGHWLDDRIADSSSVLDVKPDLSQVKIANDIDALLPPTSSSAAPEVQAPPSRSPETREIAEKITSNAAEVIKSDAIEREKIEREIESLATAILNDLARNRLTLPAGNNALEKLNILQSLSPDHELIESSKNAIANRYIIWIDSAINVEDYTQAERHLERLMNLNIEPTLLNELKGNINSARNLAKANTEPKQPTLTTPLVEQIDDSVNVYDELIASAENAINVGEFQSAKQLLDSALRTGADPNKIKNLSLKLNKAEADWLIANTQTTPSQSDEATDEVEATSTTKKPDDKPSRRPSILVNF